VLRELARLEILEDEVHHLRLKVVRALYRELHPSRYLETIKGVGQDSAAVYIAFIGDILRFPSLNDFRGWSGAIPFSKQRGFAQAKGLHITQAGPDLIKATVSLKKSAARTTIGYAQPEQSNGWSNVIGDARRNKEAKDNSNRPA